MSTWTPLAPFANRKILKKARVFVSLQAQLTLATKIQVVHKEKSALRVQLTWQKGTTFYPMARVAKETCKQAFVKRADKDTQDPAEATQNGNSSEVWVLSKKD